MRAIAARLGVSATALYQHFDGKSAILTIDNPVSPRVVGRRPGHRIGLDNVRQRLELMFHGEADVEVIEAPERFVVTLRFPAAGAGT